MVDDRLVTMQVCVRLQLQPITLTHSFVALGYCGSGALPIVGRCILPRR